VKLVIHHLASGISALSADYLMQAYSTRTNGPRVQLTDQ